MPQQLLPDLFRTEYGKIVATLVRSFGVEHLAMAEDIVSDTFLLAAETWGTKGLPANPTAWLYRVAQNKARDGFRRASIFNEKIRPELARQSTKEELTLDFSAPGLEDSQLRMLFVLCHPKLNTDTQVALCLRILCGFGIEAIARAFLTNKATINKRLTRGKAQLRNQKTGVALPHATALPERLEGVMTTLYLLFNEGYFSPIREEAFGRQLCFEAIRLTLLLTKNKRTDRPEVNAMLALLCFQASRFDARRDETGDLIAYTDQNRSRWDKRLITQGRYFLQRSTPNGETGRYQLEAAIAFLHTQPTESPQKWPNILQLYNRLLQLRYSPVMALNRTYAYARVHGAEVALLEAKKINLPGNVSYHLLIAELNREIGREAEAKEHHEIALLLIKSPVARRAIERRIQV